MDEFAMHRAAKEGDLEGVKHLIEQGVSVDSRDDMDRTPLHWAAERGWWKVTQLLISSHCDVDPKDRDGGTPVICAAIMGRVDVVEDLLQRGARVNCPGYPTSTLLHHASRNAWVDVVQHIVESGEADLNAASNDGRTALIYAARIGHRDITALLIQAGADVNQSDARGRTALHWASAAYHTRVVQVLLETEGLDLNHQDLAGDTPLHEACWWGRPGVVKQLLIAGADTNIKNNDSETALSVLIKSEMFTLEGINLFVQRGAFFDECDYAQLSRNHVLNGHLLKDVDLCTQSIVNKFHRQSLPALKAIPNLAKKLPCIKKFELNARQMRDVENFVKCDIQTNTFCIAKARPIVLSVLCVHSLLAYWTGME